MCIRDRAGAAAKVVGIAQGHPLPPVFWLYLLNTLSVAVNLALQWHLGRRIAVQRAAAPPVGALWPRTGQ